MASQLVVFGHADEELLLQEGVGTLSLERDDCDVAGAVAPGAEHLVGGAHLGVHRLADLLPAQFELSLQQQRLAREYLTKYGCQIESWGPFAEGRKDMFTNPVFAGIGAKYGKSAAQVALRFLLQSGVVIIPKSVHKERMCENFELFDFRLTGEDMAAVEALDGGESLFFSHYDPKTVEWFMSIL